MNLRFNNIFGAMRNILIALFLAGGVSARAAIINVPAQYPTIQAAITAAAAGDTVLVADGTYTGAGNHDIDFGGKNLTVKSSGGSAACIIDCQQAGRAFYFHSGETTASRVDGFTITHGQVQDLPSNPGNGGGGGISSSGGNVTVINCAFVGNNGDSNLYQNNIAIGIIGEGGGMDGGTAINCVFTGNTAAVGGGMGDGAAINCIFSGNTAVKGLGGLVNSGVGGGMAYGTAIHCVFRGNAAPPYYYNGLTVGGPAMFRSAAVNCILWGNDTSNGPVAPDTNLSYCDVQSGYAATSNVGPGNITADPLFVNAAAGDFHLMTGSPCINAGTATALPSGVTLPVTDFDGRPRVLGSAPDMGAYEFVPAAPVAVSGRVTLEGVPDLHYVASAAAQGTFRINFRIPGAATVVYGADFGLTISSVKDQGVFTVSGVPPGVYDVTLQGWKNLRVLLPNVAIYGSLALPLVTLPAGDANGDNRIDSSDFGILIGAYNTDSAIAGGGYDGNADFNYDGMVDSSDFALLIGNFNTVGAP